MIRNKIAKVDFMELEMKRLISELIHQTSTKEIQG